MSTSVPLSAFESSSPAAKFEKLGDKVVGTIEAMNERQQTEFATGKPLYFESGDPKMQWVITIKTAEGESLSLYARGGNFEVGSGTGESLLSAIGTAVRAAGANEVVVGAQLAVVHSGLGKPKPGLNPPKLYTAQYQAPAAPAVAVDDLFG
jgi:hypothetical protein